LTNEDGGKADIEDEHALQALAIERNDRAMWARLQVAAAKEIALLVPSKPPNRSRRDSSMRTGSATVVTRIVVPPTPTSDPGPRAAS